MSFIKNDDFARRISKKNLYDEMMTKKKYNHKHIACKHQDVDYFERFRDLSKLRVEKAVKSKIERKQTEARQFEKVLQKAEEFARQLEQEFYDEI